MARNLAIASGPTQVARAENRRGVGRVRETRATQCGGGANCVYKWSHWDVARVGHWIWRGGRESRVKGTLGLVIDELTLMNTLFSSHKIPFKQHYIRAPALNDNATFCTSLAKRVNEHLNVELPAGKVFTPQLGLRCPKCTNESCVHMRTFFNERKKECLVKRVERVEEEQQQRFVEQLSSK